MRDAQVDDLIRKMLSARSSGSSKPCINANLMAAYLDGNLSDTETTEFEIHVAECDSCREVFALSIKLEPPEPSVYPDFRRHSRKTLFHLAVPIPVLGALVLAAVLIPAAYKAVKRASDRPSRKEVAEVRLPVRLESPTVPAHSSPAPEPEKSTVRQRTQADKPVLDRKGNSPADRSQTPAPAMRIREGVAGDLKAELSPTTTEKKADAEIPAEQVDRNDNPAEAPTPPQAPPPGERPLLAPLPRMAMNQASSFRETSPLNSVPPNEILLGSDKDKAAESKQIRDKVFYRSAGMWIDEKCTEHREQAIVEISPAAPERKSILTSYPELKDLLPAVIYWNNTNYLLR